MSSLVYPAALPGLTFGNTRTPVFNTGVQQALSGKESRIRYQQYPLMEFELQYELLRDYTTPSDLKALVGLFMAVGGQYDTFLFADPAFSVVIDMYMATSDGATTTFQVTALYENAGGPAGAEIIQNFGQYPSFQMTRFGSLIEYLYFGPGRTQYTLYSQDFTNSNWTKVQLTPAVAAQAAPDGTYTANVMNEATASNVLHYVFQGAGGSTATGLYTFSVFALGLPSLVDCQFIWLRLLDGVTGDIASVSFDVWNGLVSFTQITLGTSFTGLSGQIVAAGTTSGGYVWYRLSITVNKTSANAVSYFIAPAQSATVESYAAPLGNAACVLWGAQFENTAAYPYYSPGAFPSAYLATTTATRTVNEISSLGATGIVTLTAPLPTGAQLLWTGSFYYRVRFADDSMTLTQFLKNFWENKKVKLRQVKL